MDEEKARSRKSRGGSSRQGRVFGIDEIGISQFNVWDQFDMFERPHGNDMIS